MPANLQFHVSAIETRCIMNNNSFVRPLPRRNRHASRQSAARKTTASTVWTSRSLSRVPLWEMQRLFDANERPVFGITSAVRYAVKRTEVQTPNRGNRETSDESGGARLIADRRPRSTFFLRLVERCAVAPRNRGRKVNSIRRSASSRIDEKPKVVVPLLAGLLVLRVILDDYLVNSKNS